MFKIIAADQKEYGPVPTDQVRRWIAEGRANAQTRARVEGGGGDWKPLSEFPEFADAFVAGAVAVSPPKLNPSIGEKLAAEIIARDYRVDIGDCFSRSWGLVQDNFWLLFGATALVLVVRAGLGFFPVLGIPTNVILGFVLQGGLGLLFLKRLRGQPAEIGVAFSGFTLALLPLILAGLIAHGLTFVGVFLCVLPAIYLLVAWWLFTPLLILDKGLDFWPALECSRKVVTHHWWQCFGLFLLACLVGLLGLLACGVGIFFTLPIAVGATVYAYEDVFCTRPAKGELPPPAPATPAPPPASRLEPDSTTAPPSDTASAPSLPPDGGPPPAAPPPAARSGSTPPAETNNPSEPPPAPAQP